MSRSTQNSNTRAMPQEHSGLLSQMISTLRTSLRNRPIVLFYIAVTIICSLLGIYEHNHALHHSPSSTISVISVGTTTGDAINSDVEAAQAARVAAAMRGYGFVKSFFVTKTNWVNVLFVKWAWAWTALPMLVTFILYYGHTSKQSLSRSQQQRRQTGLSATNSRIPDVGLPSQTSSLSFTGRFSDLASQAASMTQQAIQHPSFWAAVARWTVATTAWFVIAAGSNKFTSFFRFVQLLSGACVPTPSISSSTSAGSQAAFLASTKTPKMCAKNGGRWSGFDISGHCFLLIHASLYIYEEVWPLWMMWLKESSVCPAWLRQMFVRMSTVHSSSSSSSPSSTPASTVASSSSSSLSSSSKSSTSIPLLDLLAFFWFALDTLWLMMLVSTCFYFHTLMEKGLGVVFAVGYWCLTYGTWFQQSHLWSPGMPSSLMTNTQSVQKQS